MDHHHYEKRLASEMLQGLYLSAEIMLDSHCIQIHHLYLSFEKMFQIGFLADHYLELLVPMRDRHL